MKHAAIYTRVSTTTQSEEGMSLDQQRDVLRKWCKENGYVVAQEFEEASSAFKDNRPVFSKMLSLSLGRDKPFDIIVFYNQSRFYRDNLKREITQRRLEDAGVRLHFFADPLPEDEGSQYLLRNFSGLFNEFRSRLDSQSVTASMKRNAEEGFFNGGPPPFGYTTVETEFPSRSGRKKRLVVSPDESALILKIFSFAANGINGLPAGVKKIASHLNEHGELRRGHRWTKQGVSDLLRCETYLGNLYSFKRDKKSGKLKAREQWTVSAVAQIVPKDLFDKANAKLKERDFSRSESKRDLSSTLLTGLLFCGICRSHMTIISGKGGKYRYYRCSVKTKNGVNLCSCPSVPKEVIESAVTNAIVSSVLTFRRVKSIVSELDKHLQAREKDSRQKLLTLRLKEQQMEVRINKIMDKIGDGELAMDAHTTSYLANAKLVARRAREEISALEDLASTRKVKLSDDFLKLFSEKAREVLSERGPTAKAWLRALVERVEVAVDDGSRISIRGRYGSLYRSVAWARTKPEFVERHASLSPVPRDVMEWCGWRGSNPLLQIKEFGIHRCYLW